MRFGIHLANWGPWGSPQAIAALAREAERLGFDSVWVSDHVTAPVEAHSVYPYNPQSGITPDKAATHYEPLVTLAYVAGMTQRVRLGTTVLVIPLRNPVYAAKLIATLDALSGGRVIIGTGVGWLAEEVRAVQGPPFERRGAAVDEYLRLYRALWSDQEITAFQGEFYNLEPVRAFPKPAQGARVPLWIGGHGRPGMRRALTLGDGWHTVRVGPVELQPMVAELRQMAEQMGRDLDEFALAHRTDIGIGMPEAQAKSWQLFGSAVRVAEGIEAFRETGCTDLMAELHPRETTEQMLEAMRAFAEVARVRPAGATG